MVRIKEIRLKKYDYQGDGYYFVTVVCDQRKSFFDGKQNLIEAELKDLAQKTQGLNLDYFIVMPNHAHVILILNNCDLKLGEIVRRFKAKDSHSLRANVWQPNYYEHVIRSEAALNSIRQYIIDNPQELLVDFDKFYR